jgi:hypothetical protein
MVVLRVRAGWEIRDRTGGKPSGVFPRTIVEASLFSWVASLYLEPPGAGRQGSVWRAEEVVLRKIVIAEYSVNNRQMNRKPAVACACQR